MTKHIELDKTLPELEELFERLFANLPIGAFVIQNRKFRLFNPQFQSILGYGTNELLTMDCLEPVFPEDRNVVRENAINCLKGKRLFPYEYRFVNKSGVVYWATEMVIPGQWRGKRAALGYFVDISERKLSQEAIRKSETRLAEAQRIAHLGSWEWDIKSDKIVWSDELYRIFGVKRSQFGATYQAAFNFCHPDDREALQKAVDETLQGKRHHNIEHRIVRPDGSMRTIHARGEVTLNEGGEPVRMAGTALDISDRKEAEKALRESEVKLRQMFESVTDGITVTDMDGIITQANEKTADIHGVGSKNELLGKSAFEYVAQCDREKVIENMGRTLEQGSISAIECTLLRADGSEFPGEISASVLKDISGNPTGFIAITRDITARIQVRKNMRFYISQITRAQEEERRRIARELHDDTVQSLATLSLDIQAISRARNRLSDETRQLLEQLRLKVNGTMEAVCRFSHKLRPEVLDQLGLLRALELLTQELHNEGKTAVHLEVTGSERRLSTEAELVLFRITQEALRNVSKYAHATEAVVRVEFNQKKIKLDISDNGCGFELPEVLGDFIGAGKLGLIGMQERARLLDANFSVKSEPGKGTVIAVEAMT